MGSCNNTYSLPAILCGESCAAEAISVCSVANSNMSSVMSCPMSCSNSCINHAKLSGRCIWLTAAAREQAAANMITNHDTRHLDCGCCCSNQSLQKSDSATPLVQLVSDEETSELNLKQTMRPCLTCTSIRADNSPTTMLATLT